MTLSELRGVWLTNVDSDVLFSQSAIADALDQLVSFNFNTLYPTIWQGGYTLYESTVTEKYFGKKQHPQPEMAGRNPLEEMIKYNREKKHGFAIIPWFEFGLMAPSGSALDKMHPDWFTQDIKRNRVRYSDKEPRVWLNPLMPEVQDFIEELLIEIITKHDVDGIQLDDHFGIPVEFGYDSFIKMSIPVRYAQTIAMMKIGRIGGLPSLRNFCNACLQLLNVINEIALFHFLQIQLFILSITIYRIGLVGRDEDLLKNLYFKSIAIIWCPS
jgi:hypothetical protein